MWSNILDRISFISLFIVVVLLPVFFLPFTEVPVETSKGLLLVAGLAVSVVFWSVARFSDGKISFPRSPIILAGTGIAAVYLVSSFFSGAQEVSLFGTILDVGTFWFVLAAILLMFISSVMIKDNQSGQMLLFWVVLSTAVVLIFQIFRFFLPEMLALGVLSGKTGNLIGSLNALGLVAGLTCLASLFIIEFFSITRLAKIILGFTILVSLFVISAVNYTLVWELLGILALLVFVYKISFFSHLKHTENGKVNFPAFSFAIVMISLLFFMSGQFIGSFIPGRLGITNVEVSPSMGATFEVAKQSIKQDPVLGFGPNRFGEIWAMYKPAAINETIFWDVSFSSGSGLLPTLAVTTGLLGILGWVIFFVLFIGSGVKSLFSSIRHSTHREMVSFFILALFLFLASFFYSAGPVILLLAFAFTGVYIGLASNRENGILAVSFLDDHRKSFFFILSLVLVLLLSSAIAFKYVERFASVSYFGKALKAGTITEAQSHIGKALSLHVNDLYLRTYSQVYLLDMNALLSKGSELTEAEKAQLQTSFDQALSGAAGAVRYNGKNYLNHQALGNVYTAAGLLGVDDAYSKAAESYKAASALNPKNPGLKLAIARAYLSDNKISTAKELAAEARMLKPDYIDAYLLSSQIAQKAGSSSEAVRFAEQALALSPSNEDLIKYVNSLKGGN